MGILPNTSPETWKLDAINALLKNIIDLALLLAGGIAVIYLIIGAYGYFTAFGNEERANKAKTTITWAIIGVVVIILSMVIINEVWNLVATTPATFPT
ncbi:MAG TPA: pilin [Patescibacteria group bacterium]|nr:pilin [Patescibacteria group bacterium]